MAMNLIPLDDHVFIEMIEEEGITKHGLILTAGAKKIPTFGRVVAIGPNVSTLKVGDKVLTERYAGKNIAVDRDTHYTAVTESQILCICEDEEGESA